MTPYRAMLDTNIVSDMVRHPQGRAVARLAAYGDAGVCASIITVAELRYGCARKGSARLLTQVETVLAGIDILPFDVPADAEYGRLRAELEAIGRPIGSNDLFIAAHARSLRVTLVSANLGEFRRVRGLNVENWLE